MNVYYLTTSDGQRFFYHDSSETDAEGPPADGPEATGPRAWAERKWTAIQKAMDDPDGGVTRWVGRAWNWLHSFSHPDEAMLVQFASADEVVLHHPPALPIDQVKKSWRRYLKKRARSHRFWTVVDAVATPFAAALAILPGPNVIGFWFLYRAVYHFLAARGAGRVRRGDVPVQWRAEAALDRPVSPGPDGEPRHEALAVGAKLGDYLNWSGPEAAADAPPSDDD